MSVVITLGIGTGGITPFILTGLDVAEESEAVTGSQAVRMYYAGPRQHVNADPAHTMSTVTEETQSARPAHTHGAAGRRTEDA